MERPLRENLLQRILTLEGTRHACGSVLVLAFSWMVITAATSRDGLALNGAKVGEDFAAFHTAGLILNQGEADRLYDISFQREHYRRLFPTLKREVRLPYPQPPFFALMFRPLASLPLTAAWLAWCAISVAMFVLGTVWVSRGAGGIAFDRMTLFLLCLSFEPFVFECLLGGQIACFGYLAICLALAMERTGRPIRAGLSLALLLYKPTFLILIVPVLVVGRRWRVLAGWGIGCVMLALLSWVGVGSAACQGYVETLGSYARMTAEAPGAFRLTKFIDLASFWGILAGGATWGGWIVVALLGGGLAMGILRRAARYADLPAERRGLLWASVLMATLVCNVHVGVYDAVWVVPAMLLAAGALGPAVREIRWEVIALAVVPWVTPLAARAFRIQVMTAVLFGVAVRLLWRSGRP